VAGDGPKPWHLECTYPMWDRVSTYFYSLPTMIVLVLSAYSLQVGNAVTAARGLPLGRSDEKVISQQRFLVFLSVHLAAESWKDIDRVSGRCYPFQWTGELKPSAP